VADEKTTIVGKVGVKIYPKTDDFYRETKRDLEAAERRLDEVEVPVKLDDNRVLRELRELLARVNEKAKQSAAEINTGLDKTGALKDATELEAELNKKLDDVKIRTKATGGMFATPEGLAGQKAINQLKGRLKTEELIAKINRDAARDQLVNNGKIGDDLKNRLKVEKLVAKAATDAARASRESAEAAQRAGLQQLQAEREMQRAFDERMRATQAAGVQQLQAEKEMRRAAEDRAKAAQKLVDDQQRAGQLQLQAEKEMRDEFTKRAKAQRKALADQAKLRREMALTTREAAKLRAQVEDLKLRKIIDPDTYGDLRALQTELNDLTAKLHMTVDPEDRERIKHDAERIKDEIEDKLDNIQADVKPNLVFAAMKYAQLALAKLARTRFVTFVPTVSKAGAARVATALAALSGARGANKLLTDLADMTKNLDKNLPKIATFATALVGLAGWAGQAASNLFSLANSIAAIGPGALALPGLLGGIAIGVGVTIVALKDFNKQIPEAKKGWKDLSQTIKTNFWGQAEAPIRRLGKTLFPALKRGIGASAVELGKFFGTFADGLRKELGGNPLKNMFEDLRKSIDIATDHTGSMAKIIRILGESGAGQLPRLARFFGELTDSFAKFLDKADKSGELDEWIETAIQGMKDLGNVVKGIARIFAGLGKAALAGGGSTLKTLGDTLNDIANVVNGPTFQKALTGVLQAANEAMQTIAKVSGPAVNDMFLTLSDTLQKVLPIVGQTLGTAIKAIAIGLSDPQLQKGIVALFEGINKAVESLAPAIDVLAPALGSLLSVLGTAAATFAPIGALILETVGRAFIVLAPAIEAVVKALGGAFLEVLKVLSPIIVQVAEDLAPIIETVGGQLAEALKQSAPYLGEFVQILGDALGEALKVIGNRLPDIVNKLLPQLLDVVKNIVPKLPKLIDGFLGLVDTLVNTDLVKSLGDLAGALLDIVNSDVIPTLNEQLPRTADALIAVSKALEGLVKFIDGLDIFGDLLTLVGGTGPDTVTGFYDAGAKIGVALMNGMLGGFGEGLAKVIGWLLWLTSMIPQWKGPPETDATLLTPAGTSIMQSLVDGFASVDIMGALGKITESIKSFFSGAGTWLTDKGKALIDGLTGGIGNGAGGATGKTGEVKTGIGDKFSDAGSYLTSKGSSLMSGLISGVGKKYDDVKTSAKTALQKAKDGTNGADTSLKQAGIDVISGFVRWIENGFDRVQGVLNRLTDMLPDWKGPRSTDKVILKEAGQLVIQGFVDGLQSQFSLVKDTLGSLSDEIGNTTLAAPTVTGIDTADLKGLKTRVGAQIAVQGQADGSTTQGQIVFNIDNHNPVSEPTSVTVTKALRTAGQMGVLGQ
jgi:phage-related protein